MSKLNFDYDCIILGGGPAGMSASIYCKRSGLDCCIIEPVILGGRPTGYLEIENYLGLGKTSTFDMIEKFRNHVESFSIPIFEGEEIQEVALRNKIVKISDDTFKAKAIIIATGSRPKLLNVKGEKEFTGKGVHYCAICDGHFYKDKVVAVIGGGNSACEEALGLSKICKKVYLIEFTSKLNADKVTLDLVKKKENIQVYLQTSVAEIMGSERVEKIKIHDELERNNMMDTNGYTIIDIDAVFPYIGMTANSEMFDLKKDNNGFIITDEYMQTDILGVYAIGDVRTKILRQVVTAVSDGAIAGVQVGRYLNS